MITEALNIVKGFLVNHEKIICFLRFGAMQTIFFDAIQVSF